MKADFVEKVVVSDMHSCKETLDDILRFVSDGLAVISKDEFLDLKLMFSELLFNAAIHGNKLDRTKKIYVRVEIKGSEVYSVIRDDGPGFDFTRALSLAGDGASEHGRGVKLAYSLADAMEFNARGNEIRFCKKVRPDV